MEPNRVADYLRPSPRTLRAWGLAGIILWVIVGAGIVAVGAGHVFFILTEALSAFLITGLIVVLTKPFVRFMRKHGVSKGLAASIGTLAALVVLCGLALFFAAPIVIGAQSFFVALQAGGSRTAADAAKIVSGFQALPPGIKTGLTEVVRTAGAMLVSVGKGALGIILGSAASVLTVGFNVFLALILTLWFLLDGEAMAEHMYNVVPVKWRDDAREVVGAFNRSFSGYLTGTAINVSVLFVLAIAGFLFIRLPFAWFLAVFIAALDVIPFIGPILAGAVAVLVGLSQSPTLALETLVVVLVAEQIVDSFVSPIVMGNSVRIHPVAIIFSLIIGATFAGLLGAVLAIPVAAAVKTIYLYFRDVRPKTGGADADLAGAATDAVSERA